MIKTARELATACLDVAKNYKTLYVMGCIGAPMTETNKTRYYNHHSYNRGADRVKKMQAATADTFGFDCVCLIKALLWGWCGDKSHIYGGTAYASNGVPDKSANGLFAECTDVSTNFSRIQVGEAVWMDGHIGIYIGDGLAVECTPIWKDGVQITAVGNIGAKSGYNLRTWTKHGKLPWVTYEANDNNEEGEIVVKVSTLKKGAKGDQVRALQALLIGYGHLGIYGADGSFGGDTDTAVRAYQKAEGLTVDGVVGSATWAKLLGK